MPNGSNLFGGNSTHGSGKICPVPGSCYEFYVFSINTATETQSIDNLYLSKVDMNLVGNGIVSVPFGDVVGNEKISYGQLMFLKLSK